VNYDDRHPDIDAPDLFVRCSSFPPFVWQLQERAYPNRLLAVSRDMEAILAAVRLHAAKPSDESGGRR
jgi:hypothetical protein